MNIGDKVKIVKTPYAAPELGVGHTGRIVDVCSQDYARMYDVEMDSGRVLGFLDWPFYEDELEMIV